MKTNLLKSILISLILVMGVTQIGAANITSDGTARLYFKMSAVSWWIAGNNGDGNFAYFYNNSTGKNAWSAHAVKYSGNDYYVTIPEGTWAGVILTRNNTSTAPSWNNKWNQTGDITLKDDKNYISSFSEGSTFVTWGTQKPASTVSVTATPANALVGEEVSLSSALTSNTSINTYNSETYSANGGTVNGNKFTASEAGTYTITTTVTYYPNCYSKITSTATATTTVVVTSAEEPKHDVTVSWKCGETELQASQTLSVGESTANTAEAPEFKDYTFSGWDLGSGVQSADANANPISITTKASGDYTLTAKYTYIEPVIKTIYCKMEYNWWTQSSAAISAFISGTYGESATSLGTLMTLAPLEGNVWKIDVDVARYQKIRFIRVNPEGTSDWGARTELVEIPTDDKNLYTITQSTDKWSGDCPGTWSVYEAPVAAPKRYITGTKELVGGEGWKANEIEMTYDNGTSTYSHTFLASALTAGTEYKLKVTEGNWDGGKWGTINGTIPGVSNDGDGNVCFKLSTVGDVTVTFDGAKITVSTTGTFHVPVVYEYYIVGDMNSWSTNEDYGLSDENTDGTYERELTWAAGTYHFKINIGNWDSQWGWSNLEGTYKEVQNANDDNKLKVVLTKEKTFTVKFNPTTNKISFEGLTEDYYTVVGVAELFGEAWATNNDANKMAKQGDGSYKLVKENVTLAAIGYEWKIAKNGDWWNDAATGVNPSGGKNNTLTIKTPGRYNVTFTLSANLQTATAETELLEEIIVIPDCYISGNATLTGGEGWQGNEFTMVYNEETETWTYTLAGLQPEKEYELKVVCGGTWYSFANLATPVPTGVTEGNDHAIAFQMEEAGDVVVTYNKTKGITIDGNFVKFINVYLAGDMTNWGEGQLQFRKKAADDKVATVTVELTEGEYKFKIIEGETWLGNNGTMTRQYHENWIFRAKQDDGTTDEVNATIDADENGIYTFTWNSTDNKLTVTYPAPTEKYIYFKNNPGWNKVYVYFFQEHNFNDKGAVSTGLTVAEKRVGAMTQVGTSDIWQYEYGTAGLPLSGVIAFTETLQENKSNFSNTKAAYRTDFNKNMELFIPQKTSNETKNGTKYYSSGLWMKYNSIESGYLFANNIDEWQDDPLVADAPGGYHFATQVSLGGNTTYKFKIKSIKEDWFRTNTVITSTKNTDIEFKAEVGGNDVQLTTTSAGNYTFSIDLSDGKMMVSVEYPLQANDYRLVYVESEVLGQAPYTKFHPAQSIRGIAEGTKKDTVSFYINKKDGQNPAILLQKCTNINDENITWEDVVIQSICGNQGANPGRAKAPAKRSAELHIGSGCPAVTGNGVYNFTLGQTGVNATILNEETHPYTGDYYIRTNAADGGWRKYNTNPDNIMTHSQTALKHGGYDYYFCKWVLKDQSVQYVVANDYSYCVSDTLTTDAIVTNVNGILPANANVRYTWNSSTNTLSRAYLAGSGIISDRYLVLIGDANLKDTSGNPFDVSELNPNEVAFKDMENWLYQLDVKANQNTQVKLTADYNGKTQYFIGNADSTKQLIKGTDTPYALRLIYDFKTNYLVSGLVGNQTITGNLELEEVMIVRSHHEEAQTLKISDDGSVTANKAYGVMTFYKNILNGAGSQHERALYWVSFPFDVKLDEAFGFGNYGEHWIMEYYDGEARAKNGAWVDSDSYWKYITEPKGYTLEAGKGYVLCLDLDLLGNSAEFWNNENTEIALYFPSSEANPIVINNAATQRETTVPTYTCTIERDDRNIHDSNWNIIGVPAYTKIAGMTGGGVISYYRYDASKNEYDPAMTSGFNFNTMHAYMVQYAGTINWTEQATSIAALAARKSPTSKDQYTLRLALQQEGTDHDHTFIRLQEDNATAEFDMNYDLCKIINRGANIYSMINDVEVAANVLPMEERVIPIGLDIHETGNYTFAMPDGTDGITAILIDYETGKETNLLLADYTTELREGTNNERFALRVRPNHVATAVETIIDGANGQIQKYIINGALYILNNGQLYDAQGRMVQQ